MEQKDGYLQTIRNPEALWWITAVAENHKNYCNAARSDKL